MTSDYLNLRHVDYELCVVEGQGILAVLIFPTVVRGTDGPLSAQGEHPIDARCPARPYGARQETDTNERQSNEREGQRVHGTHPIQETGKCAREPLQLPGIFGGKGSPVCVEIHGRRGIESGWHNSGI